MWVGGRQSYEIAQPSLPTRYLIRGAHVGVLKVLEEMHVPVDCIAGTSMGALVGGGYASGIPAAQLEEFLKGI
jgi:Patatin-like phospholipase